MGVSLLLYKSSPGQLGKVAALSNTQTPIHRVKGEEETGKYVSNKEQDNLQKWILMKWRFITYSQRIQNNHNKVTYQGKENNA